MLFLLSKTQNYISLSSHYQQKTTKKYKNFLAKDLKDQCSGMNIKQKVRVKIWQTSIDVFYNEAIGVNRLFLLVYLNWKNDVKRDKSRRYYLPKGIIKNYSVIVN